MPATNRRQQIETMLADSPADVFLRYALSLELDKEGENERSLAELRRLMSEEPPYVPAFFMAGQQLVRLSRPDEARAHLRDGIEEARQQGNSHAAGEMSEFLAGIGGQSQ